MGSHGVTGVVWEGHLLSCSLTSAPAVPLKSSKCVINGHRLQVRVCGVEQSQRRKHEERGGNEVGILFGGKIQPSVTPFLHRS